jgi:hypothetical protein
MKLQFKTTDRSFSLEIGDLVIMLAILLLYLVLVPNPSVISLVVWRLAR